MMAEREAQLAAATARRNQLQSDLAQLGSRQSTEPGVAAEQERLNRDYDVLKQQYDKLLDDREQVRLRSDVADQTDAVKFQVVEPPSRAERAGRAEPAALLTLILFVGLGAGVGAAFVAGPAPDHLPDPEPARRRSPACRCSARSARWSPSRRAAAAPPAAALARRRRRRRSAAATRS